MRRLIAPRFAASAEAPPAVALSTVQKIRREEFLLRLKAGDYRLTSHACPCGHADADVVISEIDRYRLPLASVLCMTCGIVRIDPHLDDEGLDHFYRHLYRELYGRALDPSAYFQRQKRVGEKLLATLEALPAAATVWEVGCGAGGALSVFRDRGHRTHGNDFEARLLEFGRVKGVEGLLLGPVEAVGEAHPRLRFDLILLHHVLEHVGRPVELLSFLGTRLGPGGRIVVVVPDLSRIREHSVPAGDALPFFHVAHRYNYSRAGLARIARRASLWAIPLKAASGFPTAWSVAPEIWVQLTADGARLPARNDDVALEMSGETLLRYLRRTETLHRFGLCVGQLRRVAGRFGINRLAAAVVQLRPGALPRNG